MATSTQKSIRLRYKTSSWNISLESPTILPIRNQQPTIHNRTPNFNILDQLKLSIREGVLNPWFPAKIRPLTEMGFNPKNHMLN